MTHILRHGLRKQDMNDKPPKTPPSASQTGVYRAVRAEADQNHEPKERIEYVVPDNDPGATGVIIIRRAEGEDSAKHADDSPTESAATG